LRQKKAGKKKEKEPVQGGPHALTTSFTTGFSAKKIK
jgi:hypothetical protein